ncbi:MAG: hypothetical protein AAGL24_21135, partial [Pseudomonadota bacterium]
MTNNKIKAFRADKRMFEVGQEIRIAGKFFSKHNEKGIAAEEILSKTKPTGGPERLDCLMVFEHLERARMHWCKLEDGKLYEVEISEAEILHRADMRLVDEIGELAVSETEENLKHAKELAIQYWS